jgi:HAD superfamily hydrolase (TIGR01509 family)
VSNEALVALLARTSNVLLDFDGPVCSVFSDFTASAVAKELQSRFGFGGAPRTSDPFDILKYVVSTGMEAAAAAEAELTRLEIAAVATAAPTPGAPEVLQHFADSNRRVVVVSNNSAAAVRAYLDQHDLGRYVADVSARTEPDTNLLKPNPHLLHRAVELLASTPQSCVMIGDSVTDIEAAHVTGAPVVAYANRPGKRARFLPFQPDAIIDRMTELLPASTVAQPGA